MRRSVWISTAIGVIAAATCVGVPASAQETGTLITRRAGQIDDSPNPNARKAMAGFGACIVERSPGRVRRMAELPVDGKEYRKISRALYVEINDDCLSGGTLWAQDVLMRGAMFSALYAKDYSNDRTAAFPASLSTGYRQFYSAPLSETARTALSIASFGECVARANPVAARAALNVSMDTVAETRALKALVPTFSACIPQGSELKLSRDILRGAMAEGLYRLVRAARASNPAGNS